MRKPMASVNAGHYPATKMPAVLGAAGAFASPRHQRFWAVPRGRAVAVIALVLITVAVWAILGANLLAEWRITGGWPGDGLRTSITTADPAVMPAQGAPEGGVVTRKPIDVGTWMPWWTVINVGIFVGLGLFMRWDQEHNP